MEQLANSKYIHAFKSLDKFGQVTPRQLDVWKLVAQGKPNKIIAHELGLGEATIKVHIRMLMKQFHFTNRVELALDYYPINWRSPQ